MTIFTATHFKKAHYDIAITTTNRSKDYLSSLQKR